MPTWIRVFNRVIVRIAEAVMGLGICGIWHESIRAHKPTDARQIVASVVINESNVIVVFLTGEAAVGVGQPCGLQVRGGGAVAAEGEVAGPAAADHAPAIVIIHDAVAAQMVGVQVQQVVALAGDDLPYGDGLPGEEVLR